METKPTHAIAPVPWSVTLPDGTIERFAIRPLTITKLYEWLYLARDQREPELVALATGKDMAWIDSLDVDQFAKLAGKCNDVIFPQAARLAKGAPAAAAIVGPLLQRDMLGRTVINILSIGSGTPSSTPPASESAAATPSASPTPTIPTLSAQSSNPGSAQ